jgi:hypothetical protein
LNPFSTAEMIIVKEITDQVESIPLDAIFAQLAQAI